MNKEQLGSDSSDEVMLTSGAFKQVDDEPRYQSILESTTDIIFHTVDGNIEWISPSIFEIANWHPGDLIGQRSTLLWHPDDRDIAASLHQTAYAGTRSRGVFRLQKKGGDAIWIEVTLHPYSEQDGKNGSVGIMRDVNNQVLAEEALLASERSYRLLAEYASDIVVRTNSKSIVEWVSPSIFASLGWKPEEIIGTPIAELLHPDDAETRATALEINAEGGQSDFEARYRTTEGTYLWLSVISRPISNSHGEIVGFVSASRDITEQREAQQKLAHLAFHDTLTGLHNRAWIMDILPIDLHASERAAGSVALLFLDLDHFKVINDSLGHAAGDEMLLNVADRIRSVLRPQDRLGRDGGDSFIVVLTDVHDPMEVEHLAAQLSDVIGAVQEVQGRKTVMTVSIGISISHQRSTSETLFREADSALYRAKDAGRNRWQFFDTNMHVEAMNRFTIEGELRNALAHDEFRVWFQPIVNLFDSRIVGNEMLLRWEHPVRGILAPDEFLGIAEDSGLIIDIGRQVLNKVCAMLSASPEMLAPVSINVSGVELNKGDWLSGFKRAIARHNVDPTRIIIELTETALISLSKATREALKELRTLGVGLHLDDFGTGFSSISLLQDLPVTGLKLDRRFVTELNQADHPSEALATGLAGLVKGLHLTGIAEGIETAEQARQLHAIGWEHGQGYHFGRPGSEPLEAC